MAATGTVSKLTEVEEVRRQAEEVVLDADTWMKTPNDQLSGEAPIDLVTTKRKQQVLDLISSIKHGMFT